MKILITGANGQLGRHLTEALNAEYFDLYALSHSQLDICDYKAVNQAILKISPDIILNAAAYTNVEAAESNPNESYRVNAEAVQNLAEIANQQNIVLFHFSTDYVFSGRSKNTYSEIDLCEPLNVYGKTKRAGELALSRSMTKYICIRSSWLFSDYGNNFVRKILLNAKARQHVKVVDDEFGAPTYAGDLAEAVVQLLLHFMKNKSLEWGDYHVCGNSIMSRYGFAEIILKEAAVVNPSFQNIYLEPIKSELIEPPLKAMRPSKVFLDCSKIERTFGVMQPDWQSGLIKALARLHDSDLSLG